MIQYFSDYSPVITNNEYISLCYTIYPCSSLILYVVVCVLISCPLLPLSVPLPTGNHWFVLSIYRSVSVLKYTFLCFIFFYFIYNDNVDYLSFCLTYFTKHSTLSSSMLLQLVPGFLFPRSTFVTNSILLLVISLFKLRFFLIRSC